MKIWIPKTPKPQNARLPKILGKTSENFLKKYDLHLIDILSILTLTKLKSLINEKIHIFIKFFNIFQISSFKILNIKNGSV